MNTNEIINSIPCLTKNQLYRIYNEITTQIKQVEEAEQKHRESIRKKQSEIVNKMNQLLREYHALSDSLRTPDSDDYSYANCFVDEDYNMPVFGFTIDSDNDICVSINPDDPIAEWYREEKKERERGKEEKKG